MLGDKLVDAAAVPFYCIAFATPVSGYRIYVCWSASIFYVCKWTVFFWGL